MKKFLLTAAGVICFIGLAGFCTQSRAQTGTYTVQLSDQQIEGIKQASALCESRQPLACSRLLVYIDDLLNQARQPKPEPKKEP